MRKLFNTPEVSLIGLGIFWIMENYLVSGRISYVTLLVTWLLFLQVFYKNRICGILYGVSLAVVSAYKFYQNIGDSFDLKSLIIFSFGFIMSSALFYRYFRAKERYGQSALTVTS